jgi:hypothetical protein
MKYVLVYGIISGFIIIAVMTIGIATTDWDSFYGSEWFGYLVMLAALSVIFVAVKRYRDRECGGVIRFGRAFGLGVGIAAMAGIAYVIGWEIYLATSGRDFMAEYSEGMVRGMEAAGASAGAIAEKAAEMRQMAELYRNPLFRIPITFVEIFPVGLLVALASAALLRNPRVLPATR